MELFEYLKKELETSSSISLDTWGQESRSKFYNKMVKFYDHNEPVVRYEGETYLITRNGATNGRGGMDQGSPDTFVIKKISDVVDVTKRVSRPKPIENPDFSSVIKILEDNMDSVVDGSYDDTGNMDYYAWEAMMLVVYGNDVFDWWNKNT